MSDRPAKDSSRHQSFVNLGRLEALGDAIFAFALTLLALDLRIPAPGSGGLVQGLVALEPKLFIFLLTFLVVAQEWDVHQRTLTHVVRGDGLFVWMGILSLMFVVLMPASADILGKYPAQPLALACFGANAALLNLTSWFMWQHATHRGHLLDESLAPYIIRMISRLWLFPPIVIAVTIPLAFLSVYPVYVIWIFMPIVSYAYSTWIVRHAHRGESAT